MKLGYEYPISFSLTPYISLCPIGIFITTQLTSGDNPKAKLESTGNLQPKKSTMVQLIFFFLGKYSNLAPLGSC
ncbi:hypothetical protein BO79DRAFT_32601 [Aspergillus costaricaensis CBS 115574]|uniref:Uncharacterized protein n=1 Tax=Aspergillus costaricaensis CBS 115574 TaxID=1448317 RepID=A0ACD1IAJ3_9EURO|nr:hypothetical protein BO79DRAFT_32601 [Aspergillus costaricaensis CBS 115574]RAK87256.1 hypothetical protein BO79DRAFT_32601 [Aspergillus costaricaensis CBS 115574]